jgi:hypothetical protein
MCAFPVSSILATYQVHRNHLNVLSNDTNYMAVSFRIFHIS